MRSVRPGWRGAAAAAVAVATLTGCGAPGGSSSGGCVGPSLDSEPAGGTLGASTRVVRPGETLTVHGRWYRATCHDTGQKGAEEPVPPVSLILTLPGGREVPLGVHTPGGPDLGFDVEVHVPRGTPAGTAAVSDDLQYPTTYTFQVGPSGEDR